MNYDRNIPDKADSFNIGKINYTSQYRELMPLIKLLRKNDVSDEVIQLAVWVLTDDNVDDMVNNLDEYFGSTGLQNNILRFVDRLLGTGLASDFDSDEIKTTKKIIRQVHKPKSGIKIKR
jgi:23S rRNA A2030 N6-methylase RlmJ